jgi:hypothetical protein
MSWIAHPICFTTVHGMGSGSALRLSGMTKVREIKSAGD